MTFQWTRHRFSGGLLALDLVNTVVCRSDPVRRQDRFDDPERLGGFAAAAARFCSDESQGSMPEGGALAPLLALREAIDGWLRPQAGGAGEEPGALARLFSCASVAAAADGSGFALDVARSAMRLVDPALRQRLKICPNCDWLFFDRSKNRSRLWCDMAICGNRAKAKAFYRRSRGVKAGEASQ